MADLEQELNEDGTPKEPENKPDANVEAIRAIADTFAETLKAERSVAPAPVVVASPAPDAQETARKLLEKQSVVQEEADAMASSGEFSKAARHLMTFEREIAAAQQGDPTDSPAYKAMIVTAKRDAKRDNEPMFEKYGSEIQDEVDAMVPGDRINPDSWDEAVRRVTARHVDEIIEDRISAANEEREKEQEKTASATGRFTTPVAPGSRGKKNETEVVELDENQIAAAAMLDYTPEEYAQVIVAAEAKTIRKGWSAGMHELCDTDKPEPGRF